MKSHQKKDSNSELPKTCEKHEKDCEIFCLEENQEICSLCVLYDHKNHECISKEEAIKLFKFEILNFSSQKMNSNLKLKIQTKKEEIQKKEKNFQLKLICLEKEIENLKKNHQIEKNKLVKEGDLMIKKFENFCEIQKNLEKESNIEKLLEWKKFISESIEKEEIEEIVKLVEKDEKYTRYGFIETFSCKSIHTKSYLLGFSIEVKEICFAKKFGVHIINCPGNGIIKQLYILII